MTLVVEIDMIATIISDSNKIENWRGRVVHRAGHNERDLVRTGFFDFIVSELSTVRQILEADAESQSTQLTSGPPKLTSCASGS